MPRGPRQHRIASVEAQHRIDLEASPPRVIDQVVVGDGPEGLAVSPTGGYAAPLILNGTGGAPRTAFYRHEKSYVAPQDRGKDCAQGGAD